MAGPTSIVQVIPMGYPGAGTAQAFSQKGAQHRVTSLEVGVMDRLLWMLLKSPGLSILQGVHLLQINLDFIPPDSSFITLSTYLFIFLSLSALVSHVIKNISAVIHLLLCSRYVKKPCCSPRTAWVINVSLVPVQAGLASWLAGRGFDQAGIWHHQGRGLCPAASESTTKQTVPWLSLWEGKRSSLWHAVSTLRSLLKPAGSFLFWILLEVCESNLPPVGHWVCKCSVVTLAHQSSQGFELRTEIWSKCQVIFCLPTLSLVLLISTLCLPSAWYRVPEMERE